MPAATPSPFLGRTWATHGRQHLNLAGGRFREFKAGPGRNHPELAGGWLKSEIGRNPVDSEPIWADIINNLVDSRSASSKTWSMLAYARPTTARLWPPPSQHRPTSVEFTEVCPISGAVPRSGEFLPGDGRLRQRFGRCFAFSGDVCRVADVRDPDPSLRIGSGSRKLGCSTNIGAGKTPFPLPIRGRVSTRPPERARP